MSQYTTEVRFICESSIPLSEQGDYKTIDEAIKAGRKYIFDFPYDLFDPAYKEVLETKFLRHFYTREIGFETVGLWKLKLRDKFEMKLPYYNQLWSSELEKFNPLYDVDYHIVNTGDRFSNTESHSSGNGSNTQDSTVDVTNNHTGDNTTKYSDTPQGGLEGVVDTNWLTNATQNEDHARDTSLQTNHASGSNDQSMQSSANVHDIDDYQKHVFGKMGGGSYSKMLREFRDTFLNIDEMFLNEMEDLFMLVY